MPAQADPRSLAKAIVATTGPILFLTGAGVSVASGIAPFRGTDPDAIWNRDVREIATARYFARDPVRAWQWFNERFARASQANPNAAHAAIAALERWQTARERDFLLVTQNIDTLHERAGSSRLIKVHGSADCARCSSDSCAAATETLVSVADVGFERFRERPSIETLPRCNRCGEVMRPHVLFFDERYDSHSSFQWPAVESASRRMRLLVAVGTSFSVGVTEHLLASAVRGNVPVCVVDPAVRGSSCAPHRLHVCAPAEEVLPAVVAELEHSPVRRQK